MTSDDQLVDDLVQAVLDGDAIDWAATESDGDSTGPLIQQLRIVAAVAQAHRQSSISSLRPPVEPAATVPLESWGHLRIRERIGRGAFGEVYRAWDPRLDREVALKLIPAADTVDSGASAIIHEGRLLARVRHPNVVTIHGADRLGAHVGLWMELVAGQTLEELLRAGTVFEPAEVTRIGLELCRALSAVHAAGLLHRDIKAQNVMRADDGRVVLMDFGTGRELADEESDLTGTPLYLAPEIFQGQPATVQSDIYSLGVLLYYLVTRSYPVVGETIRQLREVHAGSTHVAPRNVRQHAPVPLARVIEQAIDPRPDARYEAVDALRLALARTGLRSRRWFRYSGPAVAVVVAAWLTSTSWSHTPTSVSGHADITTAPSDEPSRAAPSDERAGALTGASVEPPRAALPTGEPPVVAIRFKSLLDDNESDIVDGFNIDVVRGLEAIAGLHIRAAAPAADGTNPIDTRTLAQQTGASFVLEGSVSRRSGTLFVAARLVSAADGATRLEFARGGNNLLEVRGMLSLEVARHFDLQFSYGRYKTDPEVWGSFLQARALLADADPPGIERAATLLETAYARDSSFLPARATWVSAKFYYLLTAVNAETTKLDPAVKEAAREVFQLDDRLAEAWAARGWLYGFDCDWSNARAFFGKAIELNPGLTNLRRDYFHSTLKITGDIQEALRVSSAALTADPRSLNARRLLGYAQLHAGRYEEAIKNFQSVQDKDRHAIVPLARALMLSGHVSDAIPLLEPGEDRFGWKSYAYAKADRVDHARARAADPPRRPVREMLIYGGLKDVASALNALEAAEKVNWWQAAATLNFPEMRNIRDSGDPRVEEFRRRYRLPPWGSDSKDDRQSNGALSGEGCQAP